MGAVALCDSLSASAPGDATSHRRMSAREQKGSAHSTAASARGEDASESGTSAKRIADEIENDASV